MRTRLCMGCGEWFDLTPEHPRRESCSDVCRERAKETRVAAEAHQNEISAVWGHVLTGLRTVAQADEEIMARRGRPVRATRPFRLEQIEVRDAQDAEIQPAGQVVFGGVVPDVNVNAINNEAMRLWAQLNGANPRR